MILILEPAMTHRHIALNLRYILTTEAVKRLIILTMSLIKQRTRQLPRLKISLEKNLSVLDVLEKTIMDLVFNAFNDSN